MTDAEGTAQDASTASAPAAAQTPATPRDFVTEHDPAVGQAPVTVAPRRRRRWAVFLLAAVVVLGLRRLAWWSGPHGPRRQSCARAGGGWPLHCQLDHVPLVAPARRPAAGQVPGPRQRHAVGQRRSRDCARPTRQASLDPGQHLPVPRGGGAGREDSLLGPPCWRCRTLARPSSHGPPCTGSWQVYAKNIGHVPGRQERVY